MREQDFDSNVALPPGLTVSAIRASVAYIERELPELVDIYLQQANVFSSIVGIYGALALDQNSVYVKNRNLDTAQQRFPDLKRRGTSNSPPPNLSLESKASIRPWELQAHYDHPGWYIVWRYLVDLTEALEPAHPVIIWRVDIAFLTKEDWKYEGSRAGAQGGGRTHTFGLKKAAHRLADCQVYKRSDIALRDSKPVPI
jgi:hypothetical protein